MWGLQTLFTKFEFCLWIDLKNTLYLIFIITLYQTSLNCGATPYSRQWLSEFGFVVNGVKFQNERILNKTQTVDRISPIFRFENRVMFKLRKPKTI